MNKNFYSIPVAIRENGNGTEERSSRKNAKKEVTDYQIIARARKGFDLVPSGMKSNALKLAFLRKEASKLDDVQKFYLRYMNMVNELYEILHDRESVRKACDEKDKILLNLCTHVVFAGKTVTQNVIKYGVGVHSPIYGHIDLYKGQFLPDNAQSFVDQTWMPKEDSMKPETTEGKESNAA